MSLNWILFFVFLKYSLALIIVLFVWTEYAFILIIIEKRIKRFDFNEINRQMPRLLIRVTWLGMRSQSWVDSEDNTIEKITKSNSITKCTKIEQYMQTRQWGDTLTRLGGSGRATHRTESVAVRVWRTEYVLGLFDPILWISRLASKKYRSIEHILGIQFSRFVASVNH